MVEFSNRKILHVDMDAFYAAVETRDNPKLKGKPVIIGSLPGERGVVATCNYKAREFGIRSAMPISQAYKLCPHGHFMYPNMEKYAEVSHKIHKIWSDYTDIVEYIALDEGFLDITNSIRLFGSAQNIARQIKERIWKELGLTCSIGLGYSMSSAKIASEENKPNGYFEILTQESMRKLISPRNVRIVYTVGPKTAERLNRIGVNTVSDIYKHEKRVVEVLGNHGAAIVDLAKGIDDRAVGTKTKNQSIGTEHTFQTDIDDRDYLLDMLRLISSRLSFEIQQKGIFAKTVSIKITYPGMVSITRAKSGTATNLALDIYNTAEALFEKTEKKPVRLIGITLSNFTNTKDALIEGPIQMTLFDQQRKKENPRDKSKLHDVVFKLKKEHGQNILKSASELSAEMKINLDEI